MRCVKHQLEGMQLHCGVPSQIKLESGQLERTLLYQMWHAWNFSAVRAHRQLT